MGSEFQGLLQQTRDVWKARTGRDPGYAAPETSLTLSILILIELLRQENEKLQDRVLELELWRNDLAQVHLPGYAQTLDHR